MNCKTTQKGQVLQLLKRGWTTSIQCIYTIGCTTLSQRAGELRRAGHKVQAEKVPGRRHYRYRVVR